MALFGRKKSNSSNGVSQIEFQNTNERRWPMLLAALAAALLIALALFYTGRWAYRSIFGEDAPEPTPVQPTTNLNPQPSASPQPAPAPATPPPSSQLPDSGPGDVIGLFVGTTLAAAGLHYIVSLRRSPVS